MNDDDEDEENIQSSYTVCMKDTPPGHDVASVIWANSRSEALSKAARQWGCKPTDCFIYGEPASTHKLAARFAIAKAQS